jgi:hypothetical protein
MQFLLIAISLYLAGPARQTTKDQSLLVVIPLLVILVGLGLRLWLLFVDYVWIDEGITLSIAANMLQGGGIVPAMNHVPDDVSILPFWGYGLGVYGLWSRVFGVGLAQGRVLSYLLGLPALPLMYATSRLWYGRRTALVTTSIAALSILFLESTIARNNALPMAAASLIMFVHVYACQQERRGLHFAVGLLSVLALETHLAHLSLMVAWGGYYLVDYLSRVRQNGRWLQSAPLCFFLAGAIPGLLLYFYVHMLLPQNFERQIQYLSTLTQTQSSSLSGRVGVLRTMIKIYWLFSTPEILLIAAATLGALVRRTPADKHWLSLMAFTMLGYFLVGLNGDIQYTTYGMPIYLGATGALVTYGLGKEEKPGSAWERTTYFAVLLLLAAHAVGTIRLHDKYRTAFESKRRPVVTYIQENLPTDTGIMAPPVFYASLTEYQTYLDIYYPAAAGGPALASEEPEPYWQNVLLDTWPQVRVNPPDAVFPQVEVPDSYMAARHAEEVVDDLWVVTDGDLVTDANYARTAGEADLQMVAHRKLPSSLEPGTSLQLHTLWVTREAIEGDYTVTQSLTGLEGETTAHTDQQLISGWAGTTTSHWLPYQFHDVEFTLDIPETLAEGIYTLQLDLYAQDGDTSASLDGLACAPGCQFSVDKITIVPR